MVFSVAFMYASENGVKSYASKSTASIMPARPLVSAVSRSTRIMVSGWFSKTPSDTYFLIVRLMFSIRSELSADRYTSGKVILSVDGSLPTISSSFSQYFGSEVNWSHATVAHLYKSTPLGKRMSVVFAISGFIQSSYFLRNLNFFFFVGATPTP